MGARSRDESALSRVDSALSRVDDAAVRGAVRLVTRLRAGTLRWQARPLTVVVAVAALVVAGAAAAGALRPAPSGGSGGFSPVWVGVHDGDSIPAYIEESEARLRSLAAQTPERVVYALASLRRYLTPDEIAETLDAVAAGAEQLGSVTAYARAPLPDRQTERVSLVAINPPGDLRNAMTRVAERKEADAESYTAMAAAQPSGSLRDTYASNADVSRAEAAAYRAGCACVFALLVRGTAAALTELAGHPDVRAVDPAAEIEDPKDAVFAPPLPEQTDVVAPPGDAALPAELTLPVGKGHDETCRTVGGCAEGR